MVLFFLSQVRAGIRTFQPKEAKLTEEDLKFSKKVWFSIDVFCQIKQMEHKSLPVCCPHIPLIN